MRLRSQLIFYSRPINKRLNDRNHLSMTFSFRPDDLSRHGRSVEFTVRQDI